MKLRLYVMDIRELEEAELCGQALCLLDPVRKEKVLRTRGEKDRARLAGAGLLLLLAHAGLNGSLEIKEEESFAENEGLQILTPASIIQTILSEEEKRGYPLSDGISYRISDRGRPAWGLHAKKDETDRDCISPQRPAYPCFNLSHSGNYAALVTGDVPVGIDIQEPRESLHKSIGDYRRFSRMESYFKCTGRGIDLKIDACYRELAEADASGNYRFWEIPMPEGYALWICACCQ